jgi:hypothetical protein
VSGVKVAQLYFEDNDKDVIKNENKGKGITSTTVSYTKDKNVIRKVFSNVINERYQGLLDYKDRPPPLL